MTTEQEAVKRSIHAFRIDRDPDNRTFVSHGLAGTGKTTLLANIVSVPSDTDHVVAFTGKAASVLRAKGIDAQTIHSLIYNMKGKRQNDDGTVDLFYAPKLSNGALRGHTIYLDECSMVSAAIANDLIRSGAKVAAFGDPGQLPPVKGVTYFQDADAELLTIHRQALLSPIIRQAHNIRVKCKYEEDGDDFKVVSKVSLDELAAADMVLVFMRRTADRLNSSIRKHLGFNMPYPMAGERLLCLKNAPKYGLWNGAVYTLVNTFPHVEGVMVIEVDGMKVRVPEVMFNAKTHEIPVDDEAVSQFSYAYALTVHKSQGSEWDKVVLIDECQQAIRREWLYTGVTRAAKSIIIQR